MRAIAVREADPVIAGELEAAIGTSRGHDLSALHPGRIELVVPRRIQRVGPVHPLAVAADLDHLGAGRVGLAVRMRWLANDAADMHRAGQLGLSALRVLALTSPAACAPTN